MSTFPERARGAKFKVARSGVAGMAYKVELHGAGKTSDARYGFGAPVDMVMLMTLRDEVNAVLNTPKPLFTIISPDEDRFRRLQATFKTYREAADCQAALKAAGIPVMAIDDVVKTDGEAHDRQAAQPRKKFLGIF